MNQTTPANEKQARAVQARAADRAESCPAGPAGTTAGSPEAAESRQVPADAPGRSPEDVKEDPTMDEDAHEAHRTPMPTAPLGH
jgi:hypothetical protein